ncbi:MAG: hypothetical protein K2W99_00385 [Chthoniobacterales bacterium]|nr:hypothetical protein [Chthoniobacterales bacterium]
MNISNLRNFDPFATRDGAPTSDAPITVQVRERKIEVDLTPSGNQAVRKLHDSATGIPHKMGEIVDLLASPVPTVLDESSHRANKLLSQALNTPSTAQQQIRQTPAPASRKANSWSQKTTTASAQGPTTSTPAPKQRVSKANSAPTPAGPMQEDISSKIRNFKPFAELDSDDED